MVRFPVDERLFLNVVPEAKSMTDEPAAESPLKPIREKLKAAGLRGTGARLAVFQFLIGADRPYTHAEVYQALEQQGFDRTTIYRTLITLSDAGLVNRIDVGDHTWRFEIAKSGGAASEKHPHLICDTCGEVFCLEDVKVDISSSDTPEADMPQIEEVYFRGRCSECRETVAD